MRQVSWCQVHLPGACNATARAALVADGRVGGLCAARPASAARPRSIRARSGRRWRALLLQRQLPGCSRRHGEPWMSVR